MTGTFRPIATSRGARDLSQRNCGKYPGPECDEAEQAKAASLRTEGPRPRTRLGSYRIRFSGRTKVPHALGRS